DHNRRSAIWLRNAHTSFLWPPAPNPNRLFPEAHVAVDPPGSTGTTSLRFGFSHLQKERKAPVEQAPQGPFLNWKSLRKTDAPPAFPSLIVKKIQKLSLAKRGRAQVSYARCAQGSTGDCDHLRLLAAACGFLL